MNQLKSTTIDFYFDAMLQYEDDELNRYLFDLQTAFDAIEKRITELHKTTIRAMKRNSYICVQSSVNENAASNYNEFAKAITEPDHKTLIDAWEDFKRQIVRARTK